MFPRSLVGSQIEALVAEDIVSIYRILGPVDIVYLVNKVTK